MSITLSTQFPSSIAPVHIHPLEPGPTTAGDLSTLNLSTPHLACLESWMHDSTKKLFVQPLFPFFSQLTDESFQIHSDSSWSSFLIASLSLKDPLQGTPIDPELWRAQVALLGAKELIALLHYFFTHAEILDKVPFGEALELSIKPYGQAKHTYASLGKLLMKAEGKINSKIFPRSHPLMEKISAIYKAPPTGNKIPLLPEEHMANLANKIAVKGRTLLTQSSTDSPSIVTSKKLLAYKFLRQGESLQEFFREQEMTLLFKNSQNFLSDLPTPIGVYRLAQIPENLSDELPKNIVSDFPYVYVQEVDQNYYVYLQEIDEDQQWSEARKKFLIDSATEILRGHIPPLADLYHDEATSRRYQPLVDLIPMQRIGSGAGHLSQPFEKIMWPNAGLTGIRDVGDGNFLTDLIENPYIEAADLWKLEEGKTSYFLMNALAKVSLIDSLLLVARLKNQEKLDWENQEIVGQVAEALKNGQKWILSGFTEYDEEHCSACIEALPIDWIRQAKQLMFWTQTGDKGYARYLQAGHLPDGLYSPEMKIEINLSEAKNFTRDHGFFSGDLQDIGHENGPLGTIELEKAWAIVSVLAVGVYYHHHADIQENVVQNRVLKAQELASQKNNQSSTQKPLKKVRKFAVAENDQVNLLESVYQSPLKKRRQLVFF